MNVRCQSFRAALERSLDVGAAPRVARELEELSWHEHLLSCSDCRALLESEEALELLIATLPRPQLPRRLAQRVLVRLRSARVVDRELDALLALDEGELAPSALAERVLSALASERAGHAEHAGAHIGADGDTAALDRLLARAHAVEVPPGLAQRIRLRLAAHRNVPQIKASSARSISLRRRALAVAAVLAVAAGAWWFAARALRDRGAVRTEHLVSGDPRSPATIVRDPSASTASTDAPDTRGLPGDDLLAVIDVLEQWDVLMHEDVDVLLSTSLSTADESLLDDGSGDPSVPSNDNGSTTPENVVPPKSPKGQQSPAGQKGKG